jgi:AmmeMemoRadiSam system protein B
LSIEIIGFLLHTPNHNNFLFMKYHSLEALRNDFKSIEKETKHLAKVMFVPDKSTGNDEQLLDLYSHLRGATYDTIVFLETEIKQTDKKIPMPTLSFFDAGFGAVQVNDILRNEFCDEDDDFFIDDHAFNPDMELYRHLPYLQAALDDFSIVSVQICDEDPSIVREVTYVLSEIMGGRNFLLVVACSLPGDHYSIKDITNMVDQKDQSKLMNHLNSGDYKVSGAAAFQSGVFVANNWDLNIVFDATSDAQRSALTGYGYLLME